MKKVLAMAAVIGMVAASSAYADNSGVSAKAQKTASTVCAACHGANGNSVSPLYPKLASQHEAYLAKQLHDFKSGKRKNAIMSAMVMSLSAEDIQGLAAYFSAQQEKPGSATNPKLIAAGKKIYRGGVAGTGVPACMGCHSPNGAGIPVLFPRVAGQHAEYVATQLKAFRAGTRANDPNKMMRQIALRMTDPEIAAVSQYIAALH